MNFKKRNPKAYFGIYLRGIAMGAADVVPGVSGGTIAFISGIYEELLNTIKAFNFKNLKSIKSDGIVSFWRLVNGNFILALFAGIATSILSLASVIGGVLEKEGQTGEKIALWSFFFGLIIASVVYVAKQVQGWKFKEIIGLLAGGAIAYYVTIATVSENSDGTMFLFFAGAIAISAMILPGISGSFILVLLGAYQPVMGLIKSSVLALKAADIGALVSVVIPVGIFALGCLFGLLSFSRLLSWLFKKHKNSTLAALTGFMIGSLNKIWPWKKTLLWRENSEGLKIPVVTENVSPSVFEKLDNAMDDSMLVYAVCFAVIGFLVVFGLEYIGNKFKNEQ
jgi:putative membrane protein